MSFMPPSGSQNTPSRARKNPEVSGGFSAAIKVGAAKAKQEGTGAAENGARRKTPQVRIAKGTYSSLMATKILKALGFGVIALLVLYLCFAATIVRVLPTSSIGFVPVKNITFAGGLIPAGENVIVDMQNTQGSEVLDHLKQSVLPNGNAARVQVEAGPWDSFTWKEGVVIHDQQVLTMEMPNRPESTDLHDEYLVTCLEGACVPGQGYVLNENQVLGSPLEFTKTGEE